MELVLNLIWLLISGVAVAAWIRHAREQGLERSDALRGLVVLACVLVFLFPVISASDDLYACSAAVEDSFSYVRKLKTAMHAGPAAPMFGFLFFLLALAMASQALARSGTVETCEPRRVSILLAARRIGRSPPATSLL